MKTRFQKYNELIILSNNIVRQEKIFGFCMSEQASNQHQT